MRLSNEKMIELQTSRYGFELQRPCCCPSCGRPTDTPRLPSLVKCANCGTEFGYAIDDGKGTARVPRCLRCGGHLNPALWDKEDICYNDFRDRYEIEECNYPK